MIEDAVGLFRGKLNSGGIRGLYNTVKSIEASG